MTSAQPGRRTPRWARILAAALMGVLLLGPVAVLALSPLGTNAMWVFFGSRPDGPGLRRPPLFYS